MKLELKHIAPYLPYGLNAIVNGKVFLISGIDKPFTLSETIIKFLNNKRDETMCDIKPILRPLSDLTKEIEVNGEKFVPIEKYNYLRFEEISNYNGGQNVLNFIQVREHNLLLEMHFDVFGLIGQGLAIDINTL